MPHVTLEISTAEWNKLLSYFDQNPKNEEYIKGNFRFVKDTSNIALNEIGIRIRGNTSRRRPEGKTGEMHDATNPDWHHASFALNFKKTPENKQISWRRKTKFKMV